MHTQITRIVDDYDRGRLSRRQLIARLSCLAGGMAGAFALSPRAAAPQEPIPSTFRGTDLNHIALSVTDVDRSTEFYQRHLGLEVASRGDRSCFLRCREHNFVALFKGEKAGMDHYCFSVEEYSADSAVERLTALDLKPRRAGDRVYFDDPDGIEVQVAAKTHGV
ncbi:MAG: VOC family protein [Planctomycetota bacterium]|jgi:catechol 2,3-dioxygenase-like lactoylglutathione lyase family enzyme